MKKLLPIFGVLFLISCSLENQSDSVPAATMNRFTLDASNPLNPYDEYGEIHNQILDGYNDAVNRPQAVADVLAQADSVAVSNSDFTRIAGINYTRVSISEINAILSDSLAIDNAIAASAVGSAAKEMLSDFTAEYLLLSNSPAGFEQMANFIAAFEDDILAHPTLSPRDEEVLLTISSVIRHMQFRKKRPKKNTDLDWERNVFHLAGAISGADISPAEAVFRSLSLGILENR